jgi:hypothetical protein
VTTNGRYLEGTELDDDDDNNNNNNIFLYLSVFYVMSALGN